MAVASMKVPVALLTGVLGLGLGAVGGYIAANVIEEHNKKAHLGESKTDEGGAADAGPKDLGGPKGAGGGKGGGGGGKGFGGGKGGGGPAGGGPPGGGGGAPRGPSAKAQLATLVTTLDVLTRKPLTFELTADQKKQISEQLAGLETADTLTDDEAKPKLDSLLKLLEGQKAAFAGVGYVWPGDGPTGIAAIPPSASSNPLRVGTANQNLKSLQSTLGK